MEKKVLVEAHTNEETNMAAYVHKVGGEYKVSLQDLDSGKFLPTVFGFNDLEIASKKAKSLVFPDQTEALSLPV